MIKYRCPKCLGTGIVKYSKPLDMAHELYRLRETRPDKEVRQSISIICRVCNGQRYLTLKQLTIKGYKIKDNRWINA